MKRLSLILTFVLFACAHRKLPMVLDPSYRVSPTQEENMFLVQIPQGKTISDFLKEVGCGERYICTVGDAGWVYVVKLKKP